jgi:hypothetical protein
MQTQDQYVFFSSADDLVSVNGGAAAAGAAVAGNAWVTLDFGDTSAMTVAVGGRRKKLVLERVHVLRASGASGTAHIALVADVTGSAATAWPVQYESASVAAATRLDETDINAPMFSSTAGKLFFTPGGNAADTFDYFLAFKWVL